MKPAVTFARRSSGVVRDVSLTDAMILGINAAIPFAANFFLFPLYTFFLPGADWTIACIIALIISLAQYVVYASFGAAMPRSGGDYVFQSRGLHPLLGLICSTTLWSLLQGPIFFVIIAVSALSLGITPLFLMVGTVTQNSSLVNFAYWSGTPVGSFLIVLVIILLAVIPNIKGIKWVAKTNRYIFLPLVCISGIAIPWLLFSTSPTSYASDFNKYNMLLNQTSNGYATVLSSTGGAVPSFSWLHTFYLSVIIALSFIAWTVQPGSAILGEIKGAGSWKGLLRVYLIGGAFTAFCLIIPEMYGFQQALGAPFLNAIASQPYTGVPALSYYPSMGILTLMTTDSPLIMFVASIGYIAAGYFMVGIEITNGSRYLLASSIDGVTPAFLSSPNKRFRAPVNAIIVNVIFFIIFAALVTLQPSQLAFWTSIAVWTGVVLWLGTDLAAIFFPYTNPSIYKASPVAKYKGLLQICGAIIWALTLFILIGYEVIPELELLIGPYAILFLVVYIAAPVIWYFVFKRHQMKKGIDLGLVYHEIPPE
ncbi:MAG TPA: amino acid permease [Candidatus Acidoferrum sp.]|nr:amino acid permease [Candidatus Acidoferrum sp.]